MTLVTLGHRVGGEQREGKGTGGGDGRGKEKHTGVRPLAICAFVVELEEAVSQYCYSFEVWELDEGVNY